MQIPKEWRSWLTALIYLPALILMASACAGQPGPLQSPSPRPPTPVRALPPSPTARATVAPTLPPPTATFTAPPTATPTPSPTPVPLLTWEQLKNAVYAIPLEMGGPEDGQIPLEDGFFSYTPVPGSASLEQYLLYRGVAFGDINADGAEDAVVIIINISAGTGNFHHLVPVLNASGKPQALEANYIGDRVIVEQVQVVDGEVHLQFKTYRPEEPFGSTPTLQVTRRFALWEDKLDQLSEEVLDADEVVSETELRQVLPIELPAEGGILSFSGQASPFGLDRYVLSGLAGQSLTITVAAPNQDVFLSIVGLDLGVVLVRTQDEQSSWRGTVSETQDYAINVFAIGSETEYTLDIEAAASPATPAPEPAPTAPSTVTETGERVVYLTFDDGPTPPYTQDILDLLAEYDAHATLALREPS